jgi:hypothetical protein
MRRKIINAEVRFRFDDPGGGPAMNQNLAEAFACDVDRRAAVEFLVQ